MGCKTGWLRTGRTIQAEEGWRGIRVKGEVVLVDLFTPLSPWITGRRSGCRPLNRRAWWLPGRVMGRSSARRSLPGWGEVVNLLLFGGLFCGVRGFGGTAIIRLSTQHLKRASREVHGACQGTACRLGQIQALRKGEPDTRH